MSSRTKQLLRKGAIAGVAFITGIVGTVLAASVYDATIQSRANKILDAVKSNASQMDKSQVPAYYALVIMNIRSLIQVLDQVENGLLTNSDAALIEGLITPVSPTPGGTTGTTTTGSTVITGGTTPTPNDTRCAATTINGYSLPNAIYGQVKVIQKTISGKTYEQEFKCQENGTWLARGEEREITTSAAPSPTVCSGTEPTGNGVVKSSYFSGFVVGGSSTNTTWTYQSSFTPNTQEGSCKWKCDTGYTQSGNTCVKNTTTNIDRNANCSGTKPSGVGVKIFDPNTAAFGGGNNATSWTYASDNRQGYACYWTCDSGYKQSGNTCTKEMSVTQPRTVYTSDASLSVEKTKYKIGENLYGYVQGGDPNNTWACVDTPGSNVCLTDRSKWRQLAADTSDDWQKNPNRQNRIELIKGFLVSTNFPTGIYSSYVANGQYGEYTISYLTVDEMEKPREALNSNITYKDNLKLDVYNPTSVPKSQKVPVYVFVHGGGWSAGDKADDIFKTFARYFVKNGAAFVSINYTLTDSNTSGYDKVYKEVDCALKWVRANQNVYGFDMNNVNLAGWSAGGHIAFQYALNQGAYNDASCQSQGGQVQLRKVLSVAGATDLIRVPVKTILTGIETNLAYFVGAKKGTDAYLQRMRDNSPIDQLGKSNQNIEYYLYHAPDDTVLNYDEQFSPMYKAMKDRGYNVFTYTNFSGHDANTIPESAIRSVITQ